MRFGDASTASTSSVHTFAVYCAGTIKIIKRETKDILNCFEPKQNTQVFSQHVTTKVFLTQRLLLFSFTFKKVSRSYAKRKKQKKCLQMLGICSVTHIEWIPGSATMRQFQLVFISLYLSFQLSEG